MKHGIKLIGSHIQGRNDESIQQCLLKDPVDGIYKVNKQQLCAM